MGWKMGRKMGGQDGKVPEKQLAVLRVVAVAVAAAAAVAAA